MNKIVGFYKSMLKSASESVWVGYLPWNHMDNVERLLFELACQRKWGWCVYLLWVPKIAVDRNSQMESLFNVALP